MAKRLIEIFPCLEDKHDSETGHVSQRQLNNLSPQCGGFQSISCDLNCFVINIGYIHTCTHDTSQISFCSFQNKIFNIVPICYLAPYLHSSINNIPSHKSNIQLHTPILTLANPPLVGLLYVSHVNGHGKPNIPKLMLDILIVWRVCQ